MKNTPIDFASYLDADNIIIAGASIMQRGFSFANGASADAVPDAAHAAVVQAFAEAQGFTGTVRVIAVSGTHADDALAAVTTALETTYAGEKNLVIVHTGGNDVTDNRPYSADQFAALDATLQGIYEVCRENRAMLLHSRISRRYYTSEPVAPFGKDDKYGSGFYNEFVVEPYLRRTQFDPFAIDLYNITSKHPELVSSDGVHMFPGIAKHIAFHVLAKAASYLGGYSRAIKAGDSFAVAMRDAGGSGDHDYADPEVADGFNGMAYFTPVVRALEQDAAGNYVLGEVLEDVYVSHELTFANGSTGAGAGAIARVTDERWTADVLSEFMSINPANGVAQVRISGLPSRQAVRLTLAASRNAAGTDRRADVDVFGESYVLDAATNAASNELIVTGAADEDGTVLIEIACEASSQFGYLSGLIVDLI